MQQNQEALSYSMRRIVSLQLECAHTCPSPAGSGVRVVEEHRVANVQVEDHEEHCQDDHCLHLQATVHAQGERVFLAESTAIEGT